MVDQTKVETSEAKANELEKKVKTNIFLSSTYKHCIWIPYMCILIQSFLVV